jgi:hypothetical protein
MYLNRNAAMQEIVTGVRVSEQIAFDFYDASRIARWVNCFHGVANEVRETIGRPMVGWRPLENWSAPSLAEVGSYILDDQPKVTFSGDEPRVITEAIDNVRERLRNYGAATRLIGQSGVGKTKFAQALTITSDTTRALKISRPQTFTSGVGNQF